MRLRALLLIVLAMGTSTVTSGCVVAESAFITMHTYHGGVVPSERDEIRAKTPKAAPAVRGPVDVPAEAPSTP